MITGGVFAGGSGATDGNAAFISGYLGQKGSITGGNFSGFHSLVYWASGTAELDISGGRFLGDIYLQLLDQASIHFLGSGFAYDPTIGLLTGQLDDGSLLDVTIQTSGSPVTEQTPSGFTFLGALDPPSVPEPASIVMLGIGVAAILLHRRWKHG